MANSVQLMEMTWPEMQQAVEDQKVLFFCVGTIEQHGPHLPLGVDVYLPMAIATRVAEAVGGVVAPCTNYGYKSMLRAGGGPHFPGNPYLRGTTLIHVVEDILMAYIRDGWRKIVVLDWHLENVPFVQEAVDEVIRSVDCEDLKIVKIDNPNGLGVQQDSSLMDSLFGDDFPGWWVEHASIWETAAMMAAYPDLVREGQIVDGTPPEPADYDVFPVPEDASPESGVFWKATRASREKGEQILDAVTSAIAHVVAREFGS